MTEKVPTANYRGTGGPVSRRAGWAGGQISRATNRHLAILTHSLHVTFIKRMIKRKNMRLPSGAERGNHKLGSYCIVISQDMLSGSLPDMEDERLFLVAVVPG